MKKLTSIFIACLLCWSLTVNTTLAQKHDVMDDVQEKRVPPVFNPNPNFKCTDINPAYIFRFIFNGTPPLNTISSTIRDNGPWDNIGPDDLNATMYIQGSYQHQPSPVNINGVGWSLQTTPSNPRKVYGVVVRGALGSNYYDYGTPGVKDDATLEAPFLAAITAVEFCMNPGGTTAAEVTLGGKATFAKSNEGISGAQVTIFDAAGEYEPLTARTGSDGSWSEGNLEAGRLYVVTIRKKGVTFAQNTLVLTADDSAMEINFIGRRNKRE